MVWNVKAIFQPTFAKLSLTRLRKYFQGVSFHVCELMTLERKYFESLLYGNGHISYESYSFL
jgi:hypothetical protein